jgi:hypothetical protein
MAEMLPTTPVEAAAQELEEAGEEEEEGPRVITMADITTMPGITTMQDMEEEQLLMGEEAGSGMGWGWEAWGDTS